MEQIRGRRFPESEPNRFGRPALQLITDEDAFRFLAGLSSTFRVGSADAPTAALRRLPDVAAVRALVEWIATRSGS